MATARSAAYREGPDPGAAVSVKRLHQMIQKLRQSAESQLIAEPASPALAAEECIIRPPGPVDGAGYAGTWKRY
jgi:hypothetical protein